MRLGLLGGSFNPIHWCHLSIAQATREVLDLDQILFIPAGAPPHKQPGSLAPAAHRYEMVRLAIQDVPHFGLSDLEIRREGKSYSIDTIRAIQRHYGADTALFFIIGLDAFLDLPSWKEAQTLLETCHFVVISRPSTAFCSLAAIPLFRSIPEALLRDLDAGIRDRADVPIPDGHTLTFLRLPPCRSRCAR